MHEYHAVERAVKTILAEVDRVKATRVSRIVLVINGFSGFKEAPVRHYMDDLSKGTVLEGAEVVIRSLPTELTCTNCNKIFSPGKREILCPVCGSPASPANAGTALYVENIEVDTAAPNT